MSEREPSPELLQSAIQPNLLAAPESVKPAFDLAAMSDEMFGVNATRRGSSEFATAQGDRFVGALIANGNIQTSNGEEVNGVDRLMTWVQTSGNPLALTRTDGLREAVTTMVNSRFMDEYLTALPNHIVRDEKGIIVGSPAQLGGFFDYQISRQPANTQGLVGLHEQVWDYISGYRPTTLVQALTGASELGVDADLLARSAEYMKSRNEKLGKSVPHIGDVAIAQVGEFDHMFTVSPDEKTRGEEIEALPLDPEVAARLPELFKAPPAPYEADVSQSYAHLLDPNYEMTDIPEDAAVRDEGRQATAESIQQASLLMKEVAVADRHIVEIIRRHAGNVAIDENMVNTLRTNEELRQDLGAYLLKKMNANEAALPDRVRNNQLKNPDKIKNGSYPVNMTGREYASVLALSMLDGTFNESMARSEPEQRDPSGKLIRGQHRFAARMTLFGRL